MQRISNYTLKRDIDYIFQAWVLGGIPKNQACQLSKLFSICTYKQKKEMSWVTM